VRLKSRKKTLAYSRQVKSTFAQFLRSGPGVSVVKLMIDLLLIPTEEVPNLKLQASGKPTSNWPLRFWSLGSEISL
jgi:hypothetical protein